MSHAEDVLKRRDPKAEKLPVVWCLIDNRYLGVSNANKGIAEKIRADGKYEIHSYDDCLEINYLSYKGKVPDIIVGNCNSYVTDSRILCVGNDFGQTTCETSFSPHIVTPEKTKTLGKNGGSLIISTSKRTGKDATEAFMDEVNRFY